VVSGRDAGDTREPTRPVAGSMAVEWQRPSRGARLSGTCRLAARAGHRRATRARRAASGGARTRRGVADQSYDGDGCVQRAAYVGALGQPSRRGQLDATAGRCPRRAKWMVDPGNGARSDRLRDGRPRRAAGDGRGRERRRRRIAPVSVRRRLSPDRPSGAAGGRGRGLHRSRRADVARADHGDQRRPARAGPDATAAGAAGQHRADRVADVSQRARGVCRPAESRAHVRRCRRLGHRAAAGGRTADGRPGRLSRPGVPEPDRAPHERRVAGSVAIGGTLRRHRSHHRRNVRRPAAG
jgi:hypothetical protein